MSKIDDAINGLSPDELDLLNNDPQMRSEFKAKYGDQKAGLISKAWDALAIPEQMSRKGLGMMADAVPGREPTGNMALDVGLNAPKVAAETLAEAAPGFISRGAIATAGALKAAPLVGKLLTPLAEGAGNALAKSAESVSGLEYKTPGVLKEAFKDAGLIVAKGRKAVGQMYTDAINPDNIRPSFGRATATDLLKEANDALDAGDLTPEEALIARQTLDGVKKSFPKYAFIKMRDAFDEVAKNITKEADAAFARGAKADALRNLLPQNKLGGTSIAKSALGSLAGGLPLTLMSPAAQGSAATLLGLGMRGAARVGAPMVANPAVAGSMTGGLSSLAEKLLNSRAQK